VTPKIDIRHFFVSLYCNYFFSLQIFFVMQKFLSIPLTATGETAQLVAINGIILVEQASTTTVTITYGGASAQDVVTLTFAAMAANDVSVRDKIQDSIIAAYQTSWLNPKYDVSLVGLTNAAGATVTITGIAIS